MGLRRSLDLLLKENVYAISITLFVGSLQKLLLWQDVKLLFGRTIKDIIENRLNGLHDSITDALFREIYHRHLEIYRKSPTERYLELLSHHPAIFNIVTMREVASYLLVTPVYLSRIRKKLAKKSGE